MSGISGRCCLHVLCRDPNFDGVDACVPRVSSRGESDIESRCFYVVVEVFGHWKLRTTTSGVESGLGSNP